jgi:hypothetical protein
MLLQILKDGKIRLEALGFTPEQFGSSRELALIPRVLLRDCVARLPHFAPMMNPFRKLLQAERDQQTDHDRRDMNEKVTPSVCCVGRWMNVKHRWKNLTIQIEPPRRRRQA